MQALAKSTELQISLIALFTATNIVLGFIPPIFLPMTGIPLSCQSLAPLLAGGIIGARNGFYSQSLFVLLVLIGLPILSGGRGGLAILGGVTGGFLISWPFVALFVGYLINKPTVISFRYTLTACIAGNTLMYMIGLPGSAFITKLPISKLLLASLPFFVLDLCKAYIATSSILLVQKRKKSIYQQILS